MSDKIGQKSSILQKNIKESKDLLKGKFNTTIQQLKLRQQKRQKKVIVLKTETSTESLKKKFGILKSKDNFTPMHD